MLSLPQEAHSGALLSLKLILRIPPSSSSAFFLIDPRQGVELVLLPQLLKLLGALQ